MRRLVLQCVVPFILLSLLGCGHDARPMKVGLTMHACDGPLYLASALQFWSRDEALISVYPNDAQAYNAFKAGKVDAVSLFPHEVLSLWEENVEATIVLVLEVSNGADAIVANSTINSIAELKGKTIATDNNPNTIYMLARAMESVELTSSDINIVTFTPDSHYTAFESGDLHAVAVKGIQRERLINRGGNEIFSSRNIPGEMVQVLAINPEYLLKNRANIDQLIAKWFNVMLYIEDNPNSATKQIAHWLQVSPENLYEEYAHLQLTNRDDNIRMLVGEGASLYDTLNKLRTTMLAHNLLTHSPPTEKMINDSFVR